MRRPFRFGRRPHGPEHGTEGAGAEVRRSDRFGSTDLLTEATADIGARPGRLVMTVLGTVLGIGALVATVGFAHTAAGQIARQFTAVSATQLVVSPATEKNTNGTEIATGRLPWDAVERVGQLVGIESATLLAEVTLADPTISAVPVNDPSAPITAPPPLYAASAGLLDTIGGSIVTGRAFDDGHDRRGDRVALLGARAANRLGINRIDSQPSIFISGRPYAVIGIFRDVQRNGDLLDAVIIPTTTARTDLRLTAPGELLARIAVGAGPQLRGQVPLALAPDALETLEVGAPGGVSNLSRTVQADVNVVFLVLAVIVLLAGGLGIVNVTMLSVTERTGEIGLRRALGATQRNIAAQFMLESIIIGLLGGLIGASCGVLAVVGVSIAQGWIPVLDPLTAIGGVALGAVVGLAAGSIPARRASRIEPVAALRGDT